MGHTKRTMVIYSRGIVMPRHQRYKSKTGFYHIMMRGNERKNIFVDEEDKLKMSKE